jgi:hypothetical protein
MAKRARGSTTRPGQRAPLQRGATTSRPGATAPKVATTSPTPPPATLTTDEEARAAALEAQIVADEKAAEVAARRSRDRGRRDGEVEPAGRGGSIAVRASQEYAYVARDVRRIAIIGGGLVGLLLGLWVVVEITGMGPF